LLLSSAGILDRENAAICGVSQKAVRHWRYGTRRGPQSKMREPRCPRCHGGPLKQRAYAYLLGLYLGDGHLTRCRRDVFALNISCADAWPGLIDAAATAMAEVMPTSRVFRVQRTGCTEVKSTGKHWPCLFPQHGPGHKHCREIHLAPWQQVIANAYPGDFARGLFHSDGCRFTNRVRRPLKDGDKWYEYPRYMFTNESADILGICGDALDQLGVSWRFSRRNTISVARRDAVARLDQFVGPKY
jgi:hypothetical protein